jgi:hypothetical protein
MIMSVSDVEQEIQTISFTRQIEIAAPIEIAFEAMLEEVGPGGKMPGGQPFPMVIEQWPGGRWWRDLGDNTGHLWGHVQVIKPPTLSPGFSTMPPNRPRLSLAGRDRNGRLGRGRLRHAMASRLDPKPRAIASGFLDTVSGIRWPYRLRGHLGGRCLDHPNRHRATAAWRQWIRPAGHSYAPTPASLSVRFSMLRWA